MKLKNTPIHGAAAAAAAAAPSANTRHDDQSGKK